MDLEKVEEMAQLIIKDLSEYNWSDRLKNIPALIAEIRNLMNISFQILPEHEYFFLNVFKTAQSSDIRNARIAIKHLLEIVKIEKASESKVKEMKIFEGAEDKLKQANLSFRKDDYTSVFHNLNTALEMVLKDKVKIPMTITKVNTSNIIDNLVKHKLEPYLHLVEARKHVLSIDNKIKHQGYSPSKIDCINGIKAMEELISRLRGKEMKLTEEIRNKIYQGL